MLKLSVRAATTSNQIKSNKIYLYTIYLTIDSGVLTIKTTNFKMKITKRVVTIAHESSTRLTCIKVDGNGGCYFRDRWQGTDETVGR